MPLTNAEIEEIQSIAESDSVRGRWTSVEGGTLVELCKLAKGEVVVPATNHKFHACLDCGNLEYFDPTPATLWIKKIRIPGRLKGEEVHRKQCKCGSNRRYATVESPWGDTQ